MFEKQFVNYAGKKVIKIHLLSHKILLRWRKRSNRSLHPARNGIIFSDLSIFPFAIGEFPSRRSNIKPSKSSSDCQEVFSAIEKRESFIKKASTLPNLTPTLKRRKKNQSEKFQWHPMVRKRWNPKLNEKLFREEYRERGKGFILAVMGNLFCETVR